jgi:hypothetical protein
MRQKYLLLLLAGCSFGQTLVDLRTPGKGINFSASPATQPLQMGTTLPASRQVGQLFFNSAAAAGANFRPGRDGGTAFPPSPAS